MKYLKRLLGLLTGRTKNSIQCHHCKELTPIDDRIARNLSYGGIPVCKQCSQDIDDYFNNRD